MRQVNIETDGFGFDVEGTTIGGLHDPGSAACHDDPVLPVGGLARRAHEAAEFASHLVVVALRQDTLGNCQPARQVLVAGIGCQCRLQHIHLALCRSRLANPRTSENYDCMTYTVRFK
jgi:hypothetical protein